MKSALLVAGILVVVVRAAEKCLPTVTYYAEPELIACPLYLCALPPVITYTTTTSTTVTVTPPCPIYTIGPVPVAEVKRAESNAAICPPTWTTKPCPVGCPTSTIAQSTVFTSTATYTTYKPCPTKTLVPTKTPTIVLPSTITATPTTLSTTTKRPIITCPYHCSLPSGPVTVYNDAPAAVAPDVVCLQYCPLETM